MIDVADWALSQKEVIGWLRTLSDCPPGGARLGYGLLDAVRLAFDRLFGPIRGVALDGDAHRDADTILVEFNRRGIVRPIGESRPVKGRDVNRACGEALRIKRGMPWGFEPAWAYVFESGDRLHDVLWAAK